MADGRPDRDDLLGNSRTFCMAPWTQLYVNTNGRAHACCMAEGEPVGYFQESPLKELWNAPRLKALRLNMLASRPSPECSGCYAMQSAGRQSFREGINRAYAHHFPLVERTAPDGSVPKLNIAYLDFRFSNLCNFRCRTCHPVASSAWYPDVKAMGLTEPYHAIPGVMTPVRDWTSLWAQLEPLLPGLEEVYFAGGEPLLMPEHYRLLHELTERRLFHVRLSYNTNFSRMTGEGVDAVRCWERFERVEVRASLDAMEARGEYLRKGQRWSEAVENRRRMLAECPRVRFFVNPTVGALNALHLPDFHRRWIEDGLIEPGDFLINPVQHPIHYRVQVLPAELKARVAERYREHVEWLARSFGDRARSAAQDFSSTVEFMNQKDLSPLLRRLRHRTARLDRIRGEDVLDAFPELAPIFRPPA